MFSFNLFLTPFQLPSPHAKLITMTNFADLTTIAVGGPIASFIEPTSRVGVIEAVEDDDAIVRDRRRIQHARGRHAVRWRRGP